MLNAIAYPPLCASNLVNAHNNLFTKLTGEML